MPLYIALSLWMLILLLFGLASDVGEAALLPEDSLTELANSNKRIGLVLGSITLAALWFLTAFRSAEIGNDTKVYIEYFNIFLKGGIDRKRTFELGYQFLNVLIGRLSSDPHVFLMIMATLMYVGILCYLQRYSQNILVSVCLFFCWFFSTYLSMLRQGLAMVIVLYAYQLMKQKKTVFTLGVILLATLFHTTAIVGLLLLFQHKLFKNIKAVLLISVVCLFVSQSGVLNLIVAWLLPRYLHYFESRYASTGWLAVSYELVRALVMYLFACVVTEGKPESQKSLRVFAWLLFFTTFGFSVNLFTRAGEYFLLIAVVELPNLVRESRLRNWRELLFGIGAASLIMFNLVLIYRPGWNHLYPYTFWR